MPQGLPKTAPADPAAIWKTSRITFKKSAQDKAGTEVTAASFVAYLPGGAAELTSLCMDNAALALIGGKAGIFPAQIELMTAVVKAYSRNPAMAPLGRFVEGSMRSRYEAFENGTAGVEAIAQGLKFVELSQAVYPPTSRRRNNCASNWSGARSGWIARRRFCARSPRASSGTRS